MNDTNKDKSDMTEEDFKQAQEVFSKADKALRSGDPVIMLTYFREGEDRGIQAVILGSVDSLSKILLEAMKTDPFFEDCVRAAVMRRMLEKMKGDA